MTHLGTHVNKSVYILTHCNVNALTKKMFWNPSDASGKIRIWDTTQKEHLLKYEYTPLSGKIKDIAWTEDSKRIAVVGEGREKWVWGVFIHVIAQTNVHCAQVHCMGLGCHGGVLVELCYNSYCLMTRLFIKYESVVQCVWSLVTIFVIPIPLLNITDTENNCIHDHLLL